jgi:iron complex outermembrane receptor protein
MEFYKRNSTGQAILMVQLLQTPSNLITFNQRYSQMTYDGNF